MSKLAVRKYWNKRNELLFGYAFSVLRRLSWKYDITKIRNAPGLILFCSLDSDKDFVINHVHTSYDIGKRYLELQSEHPDYFVKYDIAYTYEQGWNNRYHIRNMLNCLRLPPYLRT
ncbi:hypothetical protein PTQ21_12290 [Paenibacillus marchantiae]|uniref:hypothetical protein n=1 Tax=Paenibacillus marchantiae TaxID=3026433 RepID=UPI00237AF4B3|nr:hypothetical protein [Paenibacillus marchantiae]WDQ34968.1 hypothetical protein PTQ21_12290 [Paenibacillus marchantiae]